MYKYQDEEGNYKGEFKKKVDEYKKYKTEIASGTLTEDEVADRKVKIQELTDWFNGKRPSAPHKNANYTQNLVTGCESEEEEE